MIIRSIGLLRGVLKLAAIVNRALRLHAPHARSFEFHQVI